MDYYKRVSVIIPVYNVAPFLAEALESAINQSYTNIEIIIIDDGSTDGSSVICEEYARKDKRIRLLKQENKGLSAARNAGLDIMTGDAVVFLDSDDAFHPDFILKMVNAMIQEKADMVICQYTLFNSVGRMSLYSNKKRRSCIEEGVYNRVGALKALVDTRINQSVWNKIYKDELWKEIRFPEGRVYEDVDTTYRILDLCNTVYVINDSLYLCRERPGSITDMCSLQEIDDWFLARSHFDSFIENNTPSIFSKSQLEQRHQLQINGLIGTYTRNYCQGKSIDSLEKFRQRIISISTNVGLGKCSFSAKYAYFLMCYCPWLLRFSYLIHRKIKSIT